MGLKFKRKERRYAKGVRVRVDVPGWPTHGQRGTVAFDMYEADGPCIILLDNGKRTATSSAEVARLRDQTPVELKNER